MALGSLGTQTSSTSTAVPASPRFLAAMLRHFSFYVSVALAAVTMVVGAVVVWREPRLNRPGVIIVVSGILSAASVALILLTHALR